jgi:hypothetical protein
VIETGGPPYRQGWEQGERLAEAVRQEVAPLRGQAGWLEWQRRLRRSHRGAGRLVRRFLPQHHERLSGVADAARVPLAALELLTAVERVRVSSALGSGGLDLRIESDEIRNRLLLRRTVPDVGGFSSVEVTASSWAGSLAGVNTEGLAVVCLSDERTESPTARLLTQELLLRTPSLEAAVEHARRRGLYVGGSWTLLVADRSGRGVRVECDAGSVRRSDLQASGMTLDGVTVHLEPAACRLVARGLQSEGGVDRVVEGPVPGCTESGSGSSPRSAAGIDS